MTAPHRKTAVRGLVALLALGVLAAPALVTVTGTAATSDPKYRKVSAPNVFYPVVGGRSVKDLKKYTSRYRATVIAAPCDATVYATHPGTAQVGTTTASSRYVVRVASARGGLGVRTAYLKSVAVTDGQIVQSGQPIGTVGRKSRSTACGIQVQVSNNGRVLNPTTFLNSYVGKKAPITRLFDNAGFTVASFNVLGASHTTASTRFATYPSRLKAAVALMESRKMDVVGTQELQEKQYDYFLSQGYGATWGAYYWDPAGSKRDTENAILWRRSTMELVRGETFDIPYFYGNIRRVPAVLLRERATGRTAWFLNVHNPADVRGDAAKYRAQALAIEKQKIINLRASGRPVFITGDFNDRQAAFCPLTADKLMISPNSVPSTTCAYPRESSIDWIFAAGQTRFSSFARDKAAQTAGVSDHPMIIARAHLQN